MLEYKMRATYVLSRTDNGISLSGHNVILVRTMSQLNLFNVNLIDQRIGFVAARLFILTIITNCQSIVFCFR